MCVSCFIGCFIFGVIGFGSCDNFFCFVIGFGVFYCIKCSMDEVEMFCFGEV